MPPHIVVNRNEPSVHGEPPDHDIHFTPTEFVEEEDYVESHGTAVLVELILNPAEPRLDPD